MNMSKSKWSCKNILSKFKKQKSLYWNSSPWKLDQRHVNFMKAFFVSHFFPDYKCSKNSGMNLKVKVLF